MDTLSHGLWGAIAFGRKNKKDFWVSFLCGVLPDLLAFGPFFILTFFGIYEYPDFSDAAQRTLYELPQFVYQIYAVTHSAVVFALVYFLIALWRKSPYIPLGAWGLHILIDIPTHSTDFFATPFLWPLSDYQFNGVSWGVWWIFIPNVVLLISLYTYYYLIRPFLRKRKARIISGV